MFENILQRYLHTQAKQFLLQVLGWLVYCFFSHWLQGQQSKVCFCKWIEWFSNYIQYPFLVFGLLAWYFILISHEDQIQKPSTGFMNMNNPRCLYVSWSSDLFCMLWSLDCLLELLVACRTITLTESSTLWKC